MSRTLAPAYSVETLEFHVELLPREEVDRVMGYWGFGPFDNDDAADWIDEMDELTPSGRSDFILRTLAVAPRPDDVDASARIMAAAATVVALVDISVFAEDSSRPHDEALLGVEASSKLRSASLQAIKALRSPDSGWLAAFSEADGDAYMRELLCSMANILEVIDDQQG